MAAVATEAQIPVLARPATPSVGDRPSPLLSQLRQFHFSPPAESVLKGDFLPALLHRPDSSQREVLKAELDELLADAPAGGDLDPFSEEAPLHLLMHAAKSRLRPARAAFREEARVLEERAAALLEADHAKRSGPRPADDAMGALGSRFIDPASLTDVLERQSAGTAMPLPRREGLEQAFATLELLAEAPHPELILVHGRAHDGLGLDELRKDGHWRIVERENPCAAAAEIFDQEAEKLAGVLRAVRRIALEAEGDYRGELHDPWLEQFDWQGFSRDELLLLPPVVAVVTADRVAGDAMVSLSRLLLSGRPVQVLVLVRPFLNPGAGDDPLSGYRFEPAYLGLSHREALVQQTSMARPAHMMQGFFRALAATHAGLHVISTFAAETALGAEDMAAAALEGRAHPIFRFDPEAGSNWAERFDFAHNPRAEEDWPVADLTFRRQGGGEETLHLAFTFADFALLAPFHACHFHPVPDGVPEAGLVPMADWCTAAEDAGSGIPFIWAVDGESRLTRLAVSRPLALACRDRLDFWRTLQELAGVRSEYVRRAAERARSEAEAKAREERTRLEASHTQELERLRRDAARDVVDRLTASLLEVDVASLTGPPAPISSLGGLSVEETAAALLELVDPATLDE